MSDNLIQEAHLRRAAYVYIRQSTATQVLVNRESTDRQYQLSERAVQLGWSKTQIKVIDEDLAQSGSGVVLRNGFAQMTNEVALGQVGIIICLEASRVARNNAEWYRLLDLCAVTNTLIGDLDGIYHPGLFNHRLLLDPGFIDWSTFESNQARMVSNYHPGPQQATGAVREGSALLQGLATCGRCGRRLLIY